MGYVIGFVALVLMIVLLVKKRREVNANPPLVITPIKKPKFDPDNTRL
jgi:hypothetical protein